MKVLNCHLSDGKQLVRFPQLLIWDIKYMRTYIPKSVVFSCILEESVGELEKKAVTRENIVQQ